MFACLPSSCLFGPKTHRFFVIYIVFAPISKPQAHLEACLEVFRSKFPQPRGPKGAFQGRSRACLILEDFWFLVSWPWPWDPWDLPWSLVSSLQTFCFAAVSTALRLLPQGRPFAPAAAKILARHQSSPLLSLVLLEFQQQDYIVSSPCEPRFALVPTCFASEAWPRAGLAEPRIASKRLHCRLWKVRISFQYMGHLFINITTARERLSWSRQAAIRVYFWYLKLASFLATGVVLIWALHGERESCLTILHSCFGRRIICSPQVLDKAAMYLPTIWCLQRTLHNQGVIKAARSRRNILSNWGSKTRASKQAVLQWRMSVPSPYLPPFVFLSGWRCPALWCHSSTVFQFMCVWLFGCLSSIVFQVVCLPVWLVVSGSPISSNSFISQSAFIFVPLCLWCPVLRMSLLTCFPSFVREVGL